MYLTPTQESALMRLLQGPPRDEDVQVVNGVYRGLLARDAIRRSYASNTQARA